MDPLLRRDLDPSIIARQEGHLNAGPCLQAVNVLAVQTRASAPTEGRDLDPGLQICGGRLRLDRFTVHVGQQVLVAVVALVQTRRIGNAKNSILVGVLPETPFVPSARQGRTTDAVMCNSGHPLPVDLTRPRNASMPGAAGVSS